MSAEDDELEKWRKSKGITDEEMQRLFSPQLRWLRLFEKLSERVDANAEESRLRAEETQCNMEFIVQQQAQFAMDVQRLQETQTQTASLIDRLATATLQRFQTLEGEFTNLESKMAALVDSHIRLADSQAQTDERLSAFITTVERYISRGRNGEQDS